MKVFTLVLQLLGDFSIELIVFTHSNKKEVAVAYVIIIVIITLLITGANAAVVLDNVLCTNKRPVKDNKGQWLITVSETFIILGALFYYLGKHIPTLLDTYGEELNCDALCAKRGVIGGVCLLFIALSAFTFLPELFRKIHKGLDSSYDSHSIANTSYRDSHLQYLVLHMLALMVDFDALYAGVWSQAFSDYATCDVDDIIGSLTCVIVGWITWSVYTIVYAYCLSNIGRIVKNIKNCKLLDIKYRCLNTLYYTTLILFFLSFFVVHILAGNVEPLSCGCASLPNGTTSTSECVEISGVHETRVAFFSYQIVLLAAMGGLGAFRYTSKYRDEPLLRSS